MLLRVFHPSHSRHTTPHTRSQHGVPIRALHATVVTPMRSGLSAASSLASRCALNSMAQTVRAAWASIVPSVPVDTVKRMVGRVSTAALKVQGSQGCTYSFGTGEGVPKPQEARCQDHNHPDRTRDIMINQLAVSTWNGLLSRPTN